MTVSREGLRDVQKRYAPLFREADLLLVARASAVLRAHGIKTPESDYSVEYAAVELSGVERQTKLANIREELEMGLITKVEAVMELNPGISEREAKRRLKEVEAEVEAEKAAAPEPEPVVPAESGDSPEEPEVPEAPVEGDRLTPATTDGQA